MRSGAEPSPARSGPKERAAMKEEIKAAKTRKAKKGWIAAGAWAAVLALYFGLNAILGLFGLKFTRYVSQTVGILLVVWALALLLYGAYRLSRVAKETLRVRKSILCTAAAVLLSLAWVAALGASVVGTILVFEIHPVHIVERDGGKYVAEVTIFLSTRYVDYFDYKNIFVCGKEEKISETYADGSDDPLEEDNPQESLQDAYYADGRPSYHSGKWWRY